jgi:K+-sensing histidine kinase KdpD
MSRRGPWLVGLAICLPLAAGAALVPLRDQLEGTNVALLLVVVVVAVASFGHRPSAVLSALSAAAAFNLFHTAPHYSLRIDSADDVQTTALLLVVGVAVGEVALRARRAQASAVQGRRDLASLHGLGKLVAEGEDADYVLMATASELMHLLNLQDCRFEADREDAEPLPLVERDGTIRWGPTTWESDRWGLPGSGVAIPVWARGRRRGRFVMLGQVGLGIEAAQLARASGLVDQAGAALAVGPERSGGVEL